MSLTFDDLQGRIQSLAASLGVTEAHLIKICGVSLVQHFAAAERWVRMEYVGTRSAPLWLNEQEQQKLVAALKGERGTEIRMIRQAAESLFE